MRGTARWGVSEGLAHAAGLIGTVLCSLMRHTQGKVLGQLSSISASLQCCLRHSPLAMQGTQTKPQVAAHLMMSLVLLKPADLLLGRR